MSTLIVIPARLGATRLPRKPLRLLGGKPLVVRVWERVYGMGLAEHVVVATDSAEVLAAATEAGATAVMTRSNHPSGTDRTAEVAARREFSETRVIVNVQGDEPFVSPEAIKGAMSFVERGAFPLGTAAAHAKPEILESPDVVKVVTGTDGRALYFSRSMIPYLRDDADRLTRDALVLQHLGVYAYSREALNRWVSLLPHPLEVTERLEQLRPLADGIGMGVAITAGSAFPGIDTEEDLALANTRWTSTNAPAARSPAAAGSR